MIETRKIFEGVRSASPEETRERILTAARDVIGRKGKRGATTREIAEVIGRRLNLPVISKAPAEAAEHFGFLGYFFGADMQASSKLTQERLGWRPKLPGLIADLDRPRYFLELACFSLAGASASNVWAGFNQLD